MGVSQAIEHSLSCLEGTLRDGPPGLFAPGKPGLQGALCTHTTSRPWGGV